jgi:hypothetical protein
MNLVQDYEFSLVVVEIQLGLGQLGPVPLGLEIQVDPAHRLGDLHCQGCLAHLARTEQDDRRGMLR